MKTQLSIDDKIDILKNTRKLVSQLLYETLQELLPQKFISEIDLRNLWHSKLKKHKEIFPKGWYLPPPHGISVLFGTDKHIQRVSPDNFRKKRFWPRSNVYLNKQTGIAVLYTSPVDRKTGIIGDFGITLYFGKNKKIQDHLVKTYTTIKQIFANTKVGMLLSQLNTLTHETLKLQSLTSTLESVTDPVGTNTGHTIPGINPVWTDEEVKIIHKSSWKKVKDLISKKRIFVNQAQKTPIQKGMAFTIEPRPYVSGETNLPPVLFHTICIFRENGVKELQLDFDKVFKLVGMNYMLNL